MDQGQEQEVVARKRAHPLLIAALGILGLILVVWGAWFLLRSGAPGEDSAEVGFARDMIVHHDQAVEMALIIQQRTEDEELRIVAVDIMLTQQAQLGQMRGWLDAWDKRWVADGPYMEWMGHPTTGPMPGMASREDIQRLQDLPVEEAEGLFLELMIVHHVAGVEMADAVLERTDDEKVTFLANAMSVAQEKEIEIMQDLLERKGFERVEIESLMDMDGHEHH